MNARNLFALAAALVACDDDASNPFALERDATAGDADVVFTGADASDVSGPRGAAAFAGLVLNEVDPAGTPEDWFELYNGSDTALDLGGVGFSDARDGAKATFPVGTRIPAHGFLTRSLSDTDPGFKLGADEELALFAPDGSVIDLVDWADGDVPAGATLGRLPDGDGDLGVLEPTPGAKNVTGEEPPPPADVALNEVTSADDDRIELVNRGTTAAALDGWWLADADYVPGDATTASHRYDLPAGTTLSAGGYLVLTKGTHHAFGLADADGLTLFDATGAAVDTVTWAAGEAVPSRCRLPDARGPMATCEATFGAVNAALEPVTPVAKIDVVLNELSASGDDAIELVNRGSALASLAGWAVTDADWNPDDPTTADHRWVFPAGSTLGVGARLVLVKDVNHLFGLGSADAVTLWDADGQAVDSTAWVAGAADVSWCRMPDGSGSFASCAAASFGGKNAASVVVAGAIVIDEVCYDEDGNDGAGVFTELWGPPGMSLDGWLLEGVNGADDGVYREVSLAGAVIPADGRLVVATRDASGAVLAARDLVGDVDWQNGPDAVRLVDPAGKVVDALQYGEAGGFHAGEGAAADDVSAGACLVRSTHADSGDNARDFMSAEPTPGE